MIRVSIRLARECSCHITAKLALEELRAEPPSAAPGIMKLSDGLWYLTIFLCLL